MMAGDERYLPARDKGPARAFTRDFVDSRFTVAGDTPEHFRDYIAAEGKKWAKVTKDAGVGTTK